MMIRCDIHFNHGRKVNRSGVGVSQMKNIYSTPGQPGRKT